MALILAFCDYLWLSGGEQWSDHVEKPEDSPDGHDGKDLYERDPFLLLRSSVLDAQCESEGLEQKKAETCFSRCSGDVSLIVIFDHSGEQSPDMEIWIIEQTTYSIIFEVITFSGFSVRSWRVGKLPIDHDTESERGVDTFLTPAGVLVAHDVRRITETIYAIINDQN